MSTETMDHPAARAVHSINNARQLLVALDGYQPALDRHEAAQRAEALLADAMADVAALFEYSEVQEKNLATMVEESNETHRELTDMKRRLGIAHQELEHLYLGASMDMERHTSRFNAVVRLRALLDAPAAPHSLSRHESPRIAVGG